MDEPIADGALVLVADDDELVRSLAVRALEKAGYRVLKTADGLDAIRWWREGKVRQIAEYCCFDVKVTKLVHEFGVAHGYVRYLDRFGQERTVEVQWPDWQ